MDVDVREHPLPPSVQRQDHAGLALKIPLGRVKQRLLGRVKEELITLLLIGHQQTIQSVRHCKHRVVILTRQSPRDDILKPSFAFEPTAARAMPIVAGCVNDTSVAARLALKLVGAERSIATTKDLANLAPAMPQLRFVVLSILAITSQRSQHSPLRLTRQRTCQRRWMNLDCGITCCVGHVFGFHAYRDLLEV